MYQKCPTYTWHVVSAQPFSLQRSSPTYFPSHALPIQGLADVLPMPETQPLLLILVVLSQGTMYLSFVAPITVHYTFFCDYVMAAAPSTRLYVLEALMSHSDPPSGLKAIVASTDGSVTPLALPQLKRAAPPRPHPLSMIDLHGGVKAWPLTHLGTALKGHSSLEPCVGLAQASLETVSYFDCILGSLLLTFLPSMGVNPKSTL